MRNGLDMMAARAAFDWPMRVPLSDIPSPQFRPMRAEGRALARGGPGPWLTGMKEHANAMRGGAAGLIPAA
jgi:hypothetical protein